MTNREVLERGGKDGPVFTLATFLTSGESMQLAFKFRAISSSPIAWGRFCNRLSSQEVDIEAKRFELCVEKLLGSDERRKKPVSQAELGKLLQIRCKDVIQWILSEFLQEYLNRFIRCTGQRLHQFLKTNPRSFDI